MATVREVIEVETAPGVKRLVVAHARDRIGLWYRLFMEFHGRKFDLVTQAELVALCLDREFRELARDVARIRQQEHRWIC